MVRVFNGYFNLRKPRGIDKITKLEDSKSVVLKKKLVFGWVNLKRRDDRIQRIRAGDKNINIVIVEKSK